MKKTHLIKHERQGMSLKGILTTLLLLVFTLPASAHSSQQGTVGWHEPPTVSCYNTGTGTGKLEIQPNATGLAGGQYAVKYHIYTYSNNQWVLTYTSPFHTYESGVRYDPLVIPATTGHFQVEAEYWWHDGRAWSGSDKTTATTYTQVTLYKQNPIASPPPAPYSSDTCYVS